MKPLKADEFREFPKLAVYDIESTQWTNVVILCHVDEWGNRKSFLTVKDYLQWLLEHFEGDCVWSHFGSGYDNRFLVDEVQSWEGSSYKAIMSGGLPIIFNVQNEDYTRTSDTGKERPRQITLLDSFRLLPTGLASIGKSIGMPKMDVDRSRIEKLTPQEVSKYCFSDCDILLAGLQKFRTTITEQGGSYSPTSASIACNFIRSGDTIEWKRFFDPKTNYQLYSGETFERMEAMSEPGMLQADEFCESAYYGGRCEVFRRGQAAGPLYYYDIASAYPWAMTRPLPLYFQGFQTGAKWNETADLEKILKHCGVSDAYVYIPKGTFRIPPLPVRSPDGKVVFAEGRFHGRWTNAELWALYKRGRDKGVTISISCWAKFTAKAFAKSFVEKFYTLRKAAKEQGDEAESLILKILLNSCYGKLAQQLEQRSFVYGPAWDFACSAAESAGTLRASPLPGVSEIVEESAGPFRHVAAGAYVTALARLKLLEGMETAMRQGARIYYCDTDSITIDKPIRHWGKSKALGSWELEHVFDEAEFLCPKVYRARMGKEWLLKAKGSNLRSQLEQSEPADKHANESLMRWCVYAREISEAADAVASELTADELKYYGSCEAGLLGWRSGIARGDISCTVATLDRSARNGDTKREHSDNQSSVPLYLSDGEYGYYDCRTMDAESLIEMELGENYADHHRDNITISEPAVYDSPGSDAPEGS